MAMILLILSGCNTSNKKQENVTSSDPDPVPKEEVIKELSGYPIPDSYEITKLIYESGAPYIRSLSNSAAKAGDYITHRDKVLNLGVYATDLCYATTYMMKQGTMNYLEASKILIDDLGISTTFNVDYAGRIEKNMDNRDSLISIVSGHLGIPGTTWSKTNRMYWHAWLYVEVGLKECTLPPTLHQGQETMQKYYPSLRNRRILSTNW